MEVPKELEGKMVAVQLARPMYMFDYLAHIGGENGQESQPGLQLVETASPEYDEESLRKLRDAGKPVKTVPVMRDVLPLARVAQVREKSVALDILGPSRTQGKMHCITKIIGFDDVVSVDVLTQFDATPPAVINYDVPSPPREPSRIVSP